MFLEMLKKNTEITRLDDRTEQLFSSSNTISTPAPDPPKDI
jgi:hypothetical protein